MTDTGRNRPATDELLVDALTGLSVGDAFGASSEVLLQVFRHGDFAIAADGPPLKWTDDTDMARALAVELATRGSIDQDALAERFAAMCRLERGYAYGTSALLRGFRDGGHWKNLRTSVFPCGSFGNGAAMRVAPLGAHCSAWSVERVVAEARASAEVTHCHPEALDGAAAVALAAWFAARTRGTVAEPEVLFDTALVGLSAATEVSARLRVARQLSPETALDEVVAELGNGSDVSCQDTVPLAIWIAAHNLCSFERAIKRALQARGDTDTTAAIVGGIVAARLGRQGIPPLWARRTEPVWPQTTAAASGRLEV